MIEKIKWILIKTLLEMTPSTITTKRKTKIVEDIDDINTEEKTIKITIITTTEIISLAVKINIDKIIGIIIIGITITVIIIDIRINNVDLIIIITIRKIDRIIKKEVSIILNLNHHKILKLELKNNLKDNNLKGNNNLKNNPMKKIKKMIIKINLKNTITIRGTNNKLKVIINLTIKKENHIKKIIQTKEKEILAVKVVKEETKNIKKILVIEDIIIVTEEITIIMKIRVIVKTNKIIINQEIIILIEDIIIKDLNKEVMVNKLGKSLNGLKLKDLSKVGKTCN